MSRENPSSSDQPHPVRRCSFGWFDGEKSHVCRTPGDHDRHTCGYCTAVHDPDIRLIPGDMGGFIRVKRTPVTDGSERPKRRRR
jgi:hypothetical protein